MLLPSWKALKVEIFFTSSTPFKILSGLIHLSETNCTISVIFQVNFLFLSFWLVHSGMQSVGQLFIKNLKCSFGYFCTVIEIIQNLNILCNLGDNKVNVFTWFFLKSEIYTCALKSSMANADSIVWPWSSLDHKWPFFIFWSLCLEKINFLILTSGNSWSLIIIFVEIFFRLGNFFRFRLLFLFNLFIVFILFTLN